MKKYITILLCVIMAFSLTACNNSANNSIEKNEKNEKNENEIVDESNDEKNEDIQKNEEDEVTETSTEPNETEVTLYFASNDYVETGDEDLEKFIEEKRIIKYDDISLEEAIIKELLKGTENADAHTAIPSSVELIDVKLEDETAFVNFTEEGLSGSCLQEELTIGQIVKSLKELENIKKVQFLINGKKTDTLMGHFDVSEPFEEIDMD